MTIGLSHPLVASDFDQGACDVGIVHLGYGAFHRAHQAYYVDEYMNATGDLRWGIAAVNLRASESDAFAQVTANKDGYVLKTMSKDKQITYQLIRAHVAALDWAGDAKAAENICANPSVQIVSITVTESGYYLNDRMELNLDHPIIAAEIAGAGGQSLYAYLQIALMARMRANAGAVTLMCCDNIRSNGKMLKRNFGAYLAAMGDADLATWVDGNVSFPCSMVDRITPKPKHEDSVESARLFGRENDATVMGEDFIQWVVEDNFAGAKPDLAKVGVTYTNDVDPFEEAKIRILNGGHTCLSYMAAMSGHATFDQAMYDDELLEHFWGFEKDEVLKALPDTIPFDTHAYLEKVADRFGNSNIGDTVERICMDGVSKFPVFVRPTLRGCFEQGIDPVFGIKSVASWYVFARRAVQGQLNIDYVEPNMDVLAPLLADGNFSDFANSELLWSDIPQKFPQFEKLLATSIEEVTKRWPV